MSRLNENDIEKFDVLKGHGNELFDLNVPGMQILYDGIVATQKAEAVSRDTSSFDEIERSVRAANARHPGDGVVVLSGAYQHMIGAISSLRKDFNVQYIPVGEMQISTETNDSGEKVKADRLRVQMQRDVGVVKHLGFQTMEDARASIESSPHDPGKPTLVIIALHETGLHKLPIYHDAGKRVYSELEKIILGLENRPSFVSYIGEDLYVENIRKTVTEEKTDDYPRNAFLQRIHRASIPVEIGAFGHEDRKGFGLGRDHFREDKFSPVFKKHLEWNGPR